MSKLKNKTAIITGGGRGIGLSIAQQFTDEGAQVIIADINFPNEIEYDKALIKIECDVTSEQAIKDVVSKTIDEHKTIDILINNAVTKGDVADITELSLLSWQKSLDVNLTGAFIFCKEVIPHMIENKKGVITTESGLQYIVMKEGTGQQPTATSNVTVHYHGTTPEGIVFDSSVDRGEPATFGLDQVIKGWTEGVALMKEGAKYRFFIPQELAYGANPRPGGPIKPYMPLVFEVELLKIN